MKSIINRIFFTKHFRTKSTTSCAFISSRFQGIGFLFDCNPVQADNRRLFVFELMLFYFKFWIIKYESNKSK